MNLSLIQNVSWLGSAALAGYLGWYLYDFKQHQFERMERLPDSAFLAALNDVTKPEAVKTADFDFDVVEKLYHKMNWTGKPPPKPKEPVVVGVDKPEEKAIVQVKSLLDVLFIREATFDPTQSLALVSYTDQNLRRNAENGQAQFRVGDHLPSPHGGIFVEEIRGDGVLFGFELVEGEDPQESELLSTPVIETKIRIVKVGEDGVVAPRNDPSIGQSTNASVYNPLDTIQVDTNRFLIGKNDAEQFATNYASIIAKVDHRQHRDPVTRQPDGIEIKDVPSGSIAAKHGVKKGDIIKSVNGYPVTTSQEAIQYAKNNSEKYTTWEIVIENQGVERTVFYESPSE
ncbi:MAG: PDZ domain-containing protein [Planctomycetota bacterium]|nr:PDZ domain-containing protein [Planctomycetota bacterium]MDG2141959.1 PDZ domain-containing protein [Planctomycetota bacterium]